MKNRLVQLSILLIAFLALFACGNTMIAPSAEVNYLSGDNKTVTVRATGVGNNEQDAVYYAETNAFDVILFRGLPGSNQSVALIGSNEIELKQKFQDYFNTFYNNLRYRTFIMSSVAMSDVIKLRGGGNSITLDIKINIYALRRDLEESGIIQGFGF